MKNINEEIMSIERKKLHDVSLMMAATICNRDTFKNLRGINAGKEVVLCGAGPSLRNYIPISDALHVALNRALLYQDVKFDWFIADDWVGIEFFQDVLAEYNCEKFFGRFSDDLDIRAIPQSYGLKCNAKWFYSDLFITLNGFNGRFVFDIDKMPLGGMPNIALEAMQILLFTNPKKIYLAGCDCSMGHFIEADAGDRNELIEQDLKEAVACAQVIEKWRVLKKFAQIYYPDVEIISINPVGLKGIFNDITQEQRRKH